jgi:hypothetical protein
LAEAVQRSENQKERNQGEAHAAKIV